MRRPDKTAFTTSDMDFRIRGSDIYFDRLNFNGDAISLRGNGEMNLDREIYEAKAINLARWLTALPPNKLDATSYRKGIAQLAQQNNWKVHTLARVRKSWRTLM